jgi:NADPH:quinone reductase-like Zn-dependent oxidoreductase
MQAVVYDRFGDDSVLSVRELPAPQPARGQVQVRVRMASLNPVDFKLRRGMLRMVGRPRRPAITGKDFAGEITALGSGVQGYRVGQRVFGSVDPMGGQGSCAEFVALSTDLIAPTPDAVSDEVVTGASGGVGSSAVQLARSIGARITGVCGAANVDYVRSIGADPVIDYKTQDWLKRDERFDVIFDAAASADFSSARPRLNPGGIYINTMPGPKLILQTFVSRLASRQRCIPFMLKTTAGQLERLARLAADQVIVPRIHEIVDLDQVGPAQRRMEEGKVHGKVCVRVTA